MGSMIGFLVAMVAQTRASTTPEMSKRTLMFLPLMATTVVLVASTTWVTNKSLNTPSLTGLCTRKAEPPTLILPWSMTQNSALLSRAM